jgi:hypothetical protein
MIIITLVALLISFLLALIFYNESKRIAKWNYYVFGFFLICISGFRIGDVMPDYATYTSLYFQISSVFNTYLIEPSFILIVELSNLIYRNEPIVLFVIYAILGVSFKFLAIKKLSNFFFFSVFIYISNYFILHEMIQIRNGVASALILLSSAYAYNREKKKFIFLILSATFFHYFSLIFFFLWFLKPNNFKKYIYIGLIPLAYLIYFINLDFVNMILENFPLDGTKLTVYANADRREQFRLNVFGIFIITRIIIFIYFVIFSKSIKRHNKYFYFLIKCYGIGVFIYIALSNYPEIAVRISQTLFLSEIIIIPTLIFTFKNRNFSRFIILLFGLLNFLLNVYFTTYFNYS